MLKDLVGRNCKIIMESLGGLSSGSGETVVFNAEMLEVGDDFIKVRVLEFVDRYLRRATIIKWSDKLISEGEETYLNLKNVVSISEL